MPRTDGALAAKLQPARTSIRRSHRVSRRAADRTPGIERAVQGSLFQERPASNVIPFDSFAPRTRRSIEAASQGRDRLEACVEPPARGQRACRRAKASWIFSPPSRRSRALCAPPWKPSSAARHRWR